MRASASAPGNEPAAAKEEEGGAEDVLPPRAGAIPDHDGGADQGVAADAEAPGAERDGVAHPVAGHAEGDDVRGIHVGQRVDLEPHARVGPKDQRAGLDGEGAVERPLGPPDQLADEAQPTARRPSPGEPARPPTRASPPARSGASPAPAPGAAGRRGSVVGHDQLGLGAAGAARGRPRRTVASTSTPVWPSGEPTTADSTRGADPPTVRRRPPSERHDALAGERAPLVGRGGKVGPVSSEQRRDEGGVARQQMHRPAGALPDEAARQASGRVEPGIAREGQRVQWRRRSLPSSRPRNRPAPLQPAAAPASRIRPKASAPREIGPAGRDMAGNVPGAWVQRKGEPPGGT